MYCRGINFVILQADFSDKIIQNISDELRLITYIKQISCFLNTFVSFVDNLHFDVGRICFIFVVD